jgi:hypothetical protein
VNIRFYSDYFRVTVAVTYYLGTAIAFATEPTNDISSPSQSVRVFGDVEALRVVAQEAPLWNAPSRTVKRRGTLREGTEVWAYSRYIAADCLSGWLLVGPSAWACDEEGVFDGRNETNGSPRNEPLTLQFVRIGTDGAIAYRSWAQVEQGLPDAELQPGFYVGIVEERNLDAERYYRTTHGLYFSANDASIVLSSAFAGQPLEELTLDDALEPYLPLGWVYVANARARITPNAPAQGPKIPRLSEVKVLQRETDRYGVKWFRTHLGWLSERELRVPQRTTIPVTALNDGQYVDVNIETQTLVAYRHETPVYATLVSTGQGPENGSTATPKGEFRIWVKLLWSDMDNLDERSRDDSDQPERVPYAVEAVPWVMFFSGGYGLHGTYWHNNFGVKKSHGCVNLSPTDAKWIFEFSSPRLNAGWQAAHPSNYDPGTIIRVH